MYLCKIIFALNTLPLLTDYTGADCTFFACIVPVKVYSNLADANNLKATSSDLKGKQGVYAFYNVVNGKQYIGSAVNLHKRLFEHLDSSKTNIGLNRAIKKYGLNNFLFYVYEFYLPSSDLSLVDLENVYISKFKFDTLYNLNPNATSSLGYRHTEQAKLKMRAHLASKENHPFFGKKHTEETKKLISKPGMLNPMYNRKHTQETRKLLSLQKCRNTVGVFDSNNVLIELFNSNVEVAKYLNCHKTTVGRYIASGKLWVNKFYIKVVDTTS
jgi:group I intron endonuclease